MGKFWDGIWDGKKALQIYGDLWEHGLFNQIYGYLWEHGFLEALQIYGDGKFIGIHGNQEKMMATKMASQMGFKKGNWGGLTSQICWKWMGIELLEFVWTPIYGYFAMELEWHPPWVPSSSPNGDVDFRQHEFRSCSERESVGFFHIYVSLSYRILPGY